MAWCNVMLHRILDYILFEIVPCILLVPDVCYMIHAYLHIEAFFCLFVCVEYEIYIKVQSVGSLFHFACSFGFNAAFKTYYFQLKQCKYPKCFENTHAHT